MLKFLKKKKRNKDISYDAICPYEMLPESERYVGPCDRCEFVKKEMASPKNMSFKCGHKSGCNTHIKDHNEFSFEPYYELPKTCPLLKKDPK